MIVATPQQELLRRRAGQGSRTPLNPYIPLQSAVGPVRLSGAAATAAVAVALCVCAAAVLFSVCFLLVLRFPPRLSLLVTLLTSTCGPR